MVLTRSIAEGMDISRPPVAEHNGRRLYAMEKDDLASIKDWRNAQMNVLRQWRPLTDTNQEEWFASLSKDSSQIVFAIRIEIKGKLMLIGYTALVHVDHVNHRAEVSFLVDPARAANKATYRADMLSALALLCRYGFEELGLHKIYAETFAFRKDHVKILEEFGFKRDGVMRGHQLKGSKYHDSILHSILDEEWASIKPRWFDE